MKKIWQLELKELIASFMVGFHKTMATKTELHDYAVFLEKSLTDDEEGIDVPEELRAVPSSCDYTDLAREDNGFMFNIFDDAVSLSSGRNEDDLIEHILSYCHSDYLMMLEDLAEEYLEQRKKQTNKTEEIEQEK